MAAPLRFITCGSVDDGKSTLIGRLLYECQLVFEDQLRALETDSRRWGTQGPALDMALLVDGLQAEREQGITIDVAYRFFATPNRRFIVADTPGHEQYTRNMATGASTADLAVLLVDARKGLLTQTFRHSRIVALLGVRHVVLAVNKMDLAGWDRDRFEAIVADYTRFAETLGFAEIQAIPLSALTGENVTRTGDAAPWYGGPSLLHHLETVDAAPPERDGAFRMPVQYVNRPNADFRGYCGRVAAGSVAVGDRLRVAPSGVEAAVAGIVRGRDWTDRARTAESVTLTLDREIDVTRGDVLAAAADPVEASDQFEAQVLWMHEDALVAGRTYLMKLHARQVAATVSRIKHRLEVDTGARLAARGLGLNEIGTVDLSVDRPVPFAPYRDCRPLGAFILIDRMTNATVGAGMIDFALRRAANIHWQALDVTKAARAQLKLQQPACIWLTGLSGSGKSTIANLLEKRLYAEGRHTYLLDGDNVRHGLNRDLGFTEADRVENIRRVAEVAKLMVDAGLVVIVSFISPFRAERDQARRLFEPGEFHEVFVDAPLEVCERRDTKGLYAKARAGSLRNFTGIDSAYEPPPAPEVHLRTDAMSAADCVAAILDGLDGREAAP